MVNPGFSLVEAIVAMTLLSVVSIAVAASSIFSLQTFVTAEHQENTLREAGGILDSLTTGSLRSAGRRHTPRAEIEWTAADSTGVATVTVRMPGKEPIHLRAMQ